MKPLRFIAEARQEFLFEVAYYNGLDPGLGERFATAVEEAAARVVAFPAAGSPSPSSIASKKKKSLFLPWHTRRKNPAIGDHEYSLANFILFRRGQ